MTLKKIKSDIAIIGMSCNFPGDANNIDNFWQSLKNGKDCISEIPANRFDINKYCSAGTKAPDKIKSNKSGFIRDLDLFDANFFGISPREAQCMDPQQRLLLENTWHALENAGINPQSLKGKSVGIFVGISHSEYASYIINQYFILNPEKERNAYHATGNALNVAAGRLAFILGTNGPTIAIDTACSSSLVAIHQASNSLHLGECEIAIVAGVNAIIDPEIGMALSNSGMISPNGNCKTFDSEAHGYVRSEGCGVVILKPKNNLKPYENVLSIIKATNINQNGASNGLTIPSASSQKTLIKQCLNKAGLKPNDIDYIEAHGTGTRLGDPIEIEAITQVFNGRANPLIIGSVKTNIGHLEPAAGIAGVIKTILSLKNHWIPKHLHFTKLNPHINLKTIPALIPINGLELKNQTGKPLRAGISSFGFSGTNAHLILEEPPIKNKSSTPIKNSTRQLFILSAKTNTSLKKLIKLYINFLKTSSSSLENICFSAAISRAQFDFKVAFKISSKEELVDKLENHHISEIKHLDQPSKINNIAKLNLNKLSEVYLKGAIINWHDFYKSNLTKLKIVILPNYTFDRTRYWLDIRSKPLPSLMKFHPLLQNYSYSHKYQEHSFTTQLSTNYPSFVKEHMIYELPVIAGATFVSMLISFIKDRLTQKYGYISDLTFSQPLIVENNKPRLLQLIVNEQNKDYEFEIISYIADDFKNKLSHCQGLIKTQKSLSKKIYNIKLIKQNLTKQYSVKEHQANTAKLNLRLGSHFHWLKDVIYNDNELIATMRKPMTNEIKGYTLYPGLIDSSFQSMMAWFDFDIETPKLHIPISISEINLSNITESPEYAYIKQNKKNKTADIYYLNKNGELITEIKNFSARKVTQENLNKFLNVQASNQAPLYFMDWQNAGGEFKSTPDDLPPKNHLQIINPKNITIDNLKNELIKIASLSCDDDYSKKTSASDILYIYPTKNKNNKINDIVNLHRQIQIIVKNDAIKSIGIIINNNLSSSLIYGYFKSLILEFSEINIYLIDSLINHNESLIKQIIISQLKNITQEKIIRIRHNSTLVPRLLNKQIFETRKHLLPYANDLQTLHCQQGLLKTLKWRNKTKKILTANEVLVDIKITSLNFRDVLKLIGTYPGKSELHVFEHGGVITKIGTKVENFKVGDRVLVQNETNFCSQAIQNENNILKIPSSISLKNACSIPGVYLTAYGCLYELANLQAGDSILIHAASGGVGLAAIQLAKLKQAIIFVTTSKPKIDYLRSIGIKNIYDSRKLGFAKQILKDTNNKGVDVILNSLTSDGFIDESLMALKNGGTFIEIGKINICSPEKMSFLRSDVNYHIYALDDRMAMEPQKTAQQLKEIFHLYKTGKCIPLPITVFDVRNSYQAFNYLLRAHHIGKVLINHTKAFQYYDYKTYIITGGLGGLGQMLVKHLIKQNVKHLIILGRKKLTVLPTWLHSIRNKNINIQYKSVALSNENQLLKVYKTINNDNPLGGIFHLAGLLQDKTIENLTKQDLEASFQAKVHGSLALHLSSQNIELDCFVMFSSISASFGSPGQANYAAANAFMEKLASKRNRQGFRSLSISWGAFAKNGMAAKNINQFKLKGLLPLDDIASFNTMDELLQKPYANGIIAVLNFQQILKSVKNEQLFSLVHTIENKTQQDFFTLLKNTPIEKRKQLLNIKLKQMVASILYIETIDEIDEKSGFFDLGFDSLMAVEMWNHLQTIIGDKNSLSKNLLFEHTSIQKLQQYLEQKIFTKLFQNITPITRQQANQNKKDIKEITDPLKIDNDNKFLSQAEVINIFLTGSTGTLGSYITKLLIEQDNIILHCLIRANSITDGYDRLRFLLEKYDATNSVIKKLRSKVKIYIGDIEDDNLGLEHENYSYLVNTINLTIHAAANLSLQETYEDLYETNVKGTKNIISLMLKTQRKNLVYVSSYSVMGNIQLSNEVAFKETDFDRSQTFNNMGYQKTKFESEKIIRQSKSKGLNWHIVRPGDLFGDTNSGRYPLLTKSIFYDMFKTVIETKVAVSTPLYFDITPVDYVAKAIVHISLNIKEHFNTYHLTNPHHIYFPDVMKIVASLGYEIDFVSANEYMNKIFTKQLIYKDKPYNSLTTSLFQYHSARAIPEYSTNVDSKWSQDILEKAGIKCSKVDAKLIYTLLNYCIKEKYLPAPIKLLEIAE